MGGNEQMLKGDLGFDLVQVNRYTLRKWIKYLN